MPRILQRTSFGIGWPEMGRQCSGRHLAGNRARRLIRALGRGDINRFSPLIWSFSPRALLRHRSVIPDSLVQLPLSVFTRSVADSVGELPLCGNIVQFPPFRSFSRRFSVATDLLFQPPPDFMVLQLPLTRFQLQSPPIPIQLQSLAGRSTGINLPLRDRSVAIRLLSRPIVAILLVICWGAP